MRKVLRFPGGLRKCITLSYDDGVESDIRLIEILKKNGMKGTFNLNSGAFAPEGTVYSDSAIHRTMTESQVVKTYTNSGMEVATHGYTHPYLERLAEENCTFELMADRMKLEQLFGCTVRGHAYPFGTYSANVIDIAKKCGIVYARTTKTTEKFDLPVEPLAWNPTCHHNNQRLMQLLDKFLADTGEGTRLFYVWGHSYEFLSDKNWNVIEDFCEKAGNRDDIWYATNIEIIDYLTAFYSLINSADGRTIYNPTVTTIYFKAAGGGVKNEKEYVIGPGETIHID